MGGLNMCFKIGIVCSEDSASALFVHLVVLTL